MLNATNWLTTENLSLMFSIVKVAHDGTQPGSLLARSLTAVKRKSMRNALVPGRRPRKFPAQISLKPLQNRCYAKKKLNDSD